MGRPYESVSSLLARIGALSAQKDRMIVAIDGGAGSGKTTLAAEIAARFGADVLHMDDFFLQPHQRTPKRFKEPGGNVDYERFEDEVLRPLSRGEAYTYRRFSCAQQALVPGIDKMPARITVVEGSYSLHPRLAGYYDLRVMIEIDADTQSDRILLREGEAKHKRFMTEWIPLENLYFDKTDIAARCDIRLRAGGDA